MGNGEKGVSRVNVRVICSGGFAKTGDFRRVGDILPIIGYGAMVSVSHCIAFAYFSYCIVSDVLCNWVECWVGRGGRCNGEKTVCKWK